MKNKKSLENSIIGLSVGHAALCPIHGILPKIALITGSSSIVSETKIGKAGSWIHEKEEEGLAHIISKLHENPYEEHHCSTEIPDYKQACQHSHENTYSDKVLNQAHIGVHSLNWLLIGYSIYVAGKRIYNKIKSRKNQNNYMH